MYRFITESLLLAFIWKSTVNYGSAKPLPPPSLAIVSRSTITSYRETFYHITIHNKGSGMRVTRVTTDDAEQPDQAVYLNDDGNPHYVNVDIE